MENSDPHPRSVQFSSVAQSCPTLCDPMNCSMPGLPVHHQLLEFTQTHVHQVSDAIQPSHPLLSPSPPDPNPSQHQSLFQWVNSSHEVANVLEFQKGWIREWTSLVVQGLKLHSPKCRGLRFDPWSGLWFFHWSCMDVRVGLWRKLSTKELILLNCGVGEDSWESFSLQGNPTSPF